MEIYIALIITFFLFSNLSISQSNILIELKVKNTSEDDLWQAFQEAMDNNFIMTAGTSGDVYNLNLEELGLAPGHAYTLLEAKEVKTSNGKEKLVHLRNPWGNGEWSGEWSDQSRKWTSDLRKQ